MVKPLPSAKACIYEPTLNEVWFTYTVVTSISSNIELF